MNIATTTGKVHAGESETALTDRLYAADNTKPAVLYCHGQGGTGPATVDPTNASGERALLRSVAAARFPVVSADWGGGNTWGNATVSSRVGEGRTAAQGSWLGAKAGKVALIGASMGSTSVLRYAKDNPANVSCVVVVLPVIDLDDVRNNDRGGTGLRASIDLAWGVTYPAALPAGANPALTPSTWASIPMLLLGASNDPIGIPSTITAFAAGAGTNCTYTQVGAGGHSQATIQAAVDSGLILSFIQAHT